MKRASRLRKKIKKILFQDCFPIRRFLDIIEFSRNKHPETQSIISKGWSFIIITSGKEGEILKKCINSILNDFRERDNYEIIVIGQNEDYPLHNSRIHYVRYKSLSILPANISNKKNIGAKLANFDTLVIMHDYISLNKGWVSSIELLSEEYDICLNKVYLQDGRRSRDWVVFSDDYGMGMLPYGALPRKDQYVNGAFFIVKNLFFNNNPLNKFLRWGESEDIEWSRRVFEMNAKIVFCHNASISYLKPKPYDDPPYCDYGFTNTKKIFESYGLEITAYNYVNELLDYSI